VRGGGGGGGGAQNRIDFRGKDGQQGGNRPNVGGGAGNRPNTGNLNAGNRPNTGNLNTGNRPGGGNRAAVNRPTGGNALGNISSGRVASRESSRGQASLGGARPSGGGARPSGGGARPGGGAAARGGGGRRSDARLKHDVALLGRLDNGIGVYRFIYNGGTRVYVGVMA